MNTKPDLLKSLTDEGTSFKELSRPGRGSLVAAPDAGARILGVFPGDQNAFWVSLKKGQPVAGGHRSWIAPEGGDWGFMFSPDWSSWAAPKPYDPGCYAEVRSTGSSATYRTSFRMRTNNGKDLSLSIVRKMEVVPLRAKTDSSVRKMRVRFTHTLVNEGHETLDRVIGLWSLIQVQALKKGTVLIPLAKPADRAAYRDNYFENVPPGKIRLEGRMIAMQVQGGERYKIGIPAAYCRGVVASLSPSLDGSTSVLIVKKFPYKPGAVYVDRPKSEQTSNGDVIQSYNSPESGVDGFYELECHAPAAKLGPDARQSFTLTMDAYEGPEEALLAVARREVSKEVRKGLLFQ